ncbi:DNA-binding transcriptional regulator [Reticulibacter mediterranei]|uniref:DNA-binding transcriptional regulator n=1 Tax=Reticulibacter mediterranei TaxID=2778369 RepID=A0A8J3IYH0_9CHLR|nr:sugar-binding transcriptional regulator [Reticulibacter mediterranei]GHO99090.1 DNA-binding transcriptional regulator [Reticulibacter mediterranei]
MARIDELRLMTKVAHLYHDQDMTQPEIAVQLDLSQATVSRLLKRAKQEQIVRVTVNVPYGVYADLEERLQQTYGLKEAVVVDTVEHSDQILRDIGSAAAYYLGTTLRAGDIIGVSSWSTTLLAMVDALQPQARASQIKILQILGGLGNPSAEIYASRLVGRLANLLHGEAMLLPAPGVVGSPEVVPILLEDRYVHDAMNLFDQVTIALVGIGTVEPSGLLASSGNIFSPEELDMLRAAGAVGDICLRFFDASGTPVVTPLNERVIGMTLGQLQQVKRAVGIAGGKEKLNAIRGALQGRLINVLITDRFTAERLI